ncbi:MAG: NAD-dependent epimerase/dehydratase family protein [Chloroflexota bacterium]|nr:MAG: NAD-dependent epimerase/dehydratase family protein [Chloroflexota bacterium]
MAKQTKPGSNTISKLRLSAGNLAAKAPFEGLVRLIADIVLINLAIIASLVVRVTQYLLTTPPGVSYNLNKTLQLYVREYINSTWLLTLICVVVFALSGFYTYGRFYRGRYKALIIIQAVSIAHLIFGSLVYFGEGFLNIYIPRGAFVISWILITSFLLLARGWAYLWNKVVSSERTKQQKPEDRKIQTVLVIGGAGYIGSALLPKLLEKGYKVKLLDLLLYGTEPIQEFINHPRLSVIQADFRQIDKVVEATLDVDAVIHLGAIVGDPACALDENLTIEINLMATRMIAEVAKGSGVGRFIFASTCSVYGASEEKLDERSALNPVSLYARSKIASEKVLLNMADERFAPVILRFGTIYGLSGRTRFDLVVNLLTAKAVVDRQITIFGGDQWRPFLHVDDAGLAILQVLEAPLPLVRNQILNVGSNEQNYTIRQIGEIIHTVVPDAEMVDASTDLDKRNYWVNFHKIRSMLSFEPRWTVEQGVQQVIEAFRSGEVLDYKDARYSNVKFLTEEGIFRLARRENGWAYQLMDQSSSGEKLIVDL